MHVFIFVTDKIVDPPNNSAEPDTKYVLDRVLGYKNSDSRMNVFFNSGSDIVFSAATLGIIQSIDKSRQTFFGGGIVDDVAKNVSDDTKDHTMEITAVAISSDRTKALTGQLGAAPVAFIWDASSG